MDIPVYCVATLLLCLIATSSAETVYIGQENATILIKHLCSHNRTVLPHTTLVLTGTVTLSRDTNEREFCLVENTTDISIIASSQALIKDVEHVHIGCKHGMGFGFFNVTNLTIKSVYFSKSCSNNISSQVIKYINESNQFFYFENTVSALLVFNSCNNVTLYNVVAETASEGNIGILGVNMCGQSNIFMSDDTALSNIQIFYIDTAMIRPHHSHLFKCSLSYTSDIHLTSAIGEYKKFENLYRDTKPKRFPLSSSAMMAGFGMYISQRNYPVNANIRIGTRLAPVEYLHPLRTLIFFMNSITNSHVRFQSFSNDICAGVLQQEFPQFISLKVLFYQTPSSSDKSSRIFSPLVIQNTSFIGRQFQNKNESVENALDIIKFPGALSYQVMIEDVSWCNAALPGIVDRKLMKSYLHALNYDQHGNGDLYLTIKNLLIQEFAHPYLQSYNNMISLVNVTNATISGTTYIAANLSAATVINAILTGLTITGNFTIIGGSAFRGGGIRLDSTSTLYLKEPLKAHFAIQENAIYAPIRAYGGTNKQTMSTVQIVPDKTYSLDNIMEIDIGLYFKIGIQNSFYAPQMNFYWGQLTNKFSFKRTTWDEKRNQYAYTTLYDAIINDIDYLDKYTSLYNGLCVKLQGEEWNCTYVDSLYKSRYSGSEVPCIHPYAGEMAVSLLNSYDRVYQVSRAFSYVYTDTKYYNKTSALDGYHATAEYKFYHFDNYTDDLYISISNPLVTYMESMPVLKVHMTTTCPPGFAITHTGSCNCIALLQTHNYRCDVDTKMLKSPPGYWTGYHHQDNRSTIISINAVCPPNYCNATPLSFVLDDSINDLLCINNRSGIVCGQCKEHYSAMFGSDACSSDCTNLYLLTLLAYAIAGPFLMLLLYAFQLTVATGTINGVVFYTNILGLSMDIITKDHHTPYLVFLRIVVSLFNLNLGFPLCFYKGMTTTARVGFHILFPVYLWSIVIGMVIISKYSIKVSNLISRSSVQVHATMLYLTFPSILEFGIDVLSFSTVSSTSYNISSDNPTSTYGLQSEKIVWYFNGTDYGYGLHGFYLFLAVIFVSLLFIYTALTTLSYYLLRFKLINKFKPYIDAYGGPFKEEMKFWFGIRLCIIIVIYLISRSSLKKDMLLMHLVIILIFVSFQFILRPFKKVAVAMIDTFLMLNYSLMIAIHYFSEQAPLQVYTVLLSVAIFILFLVAFLYPRFLSKLSLKTCKRWLRKQEKNNCDKSEEADTLLYNAAEYRNQHIQQRIRDTY